MILLRRREVLGAAAAGLVCPASAARLFSRGRVVASGYDVAARIATLRAHSVYGSVVSATNAIATSGLALPTLPQGALTEHTATSLSELRSLASGNSRHITLSPGTYTEATATPPIVVSGNDIKLTLTSCDISGPTNQRGIYHTGNRLEMVNGIIRSGPRIEGTHATFRGVQIIGNGAAPDGTETGTKVSNGGGYNGHFTLWVGCAIQLRCGFQISYDRGDSAPPTNHIIANCDLYAPTGSDTEPLLRYNGADLGIVIDSRLRAVGKYTMRAHGASINATDRVVWHNLQLLEYGIFAGDPGYGSSGPLGCNRAYLEDIDVYIGSEKADPTVVSWWRTYEDNSTVMNNTLWMNNVVGYTAPHAGTAGAGFTPSGNQAPHSSWTTCNNTTNALANGNQYATYPGSYPTDWVMQ